MQKDGVRWKRGRQKMRFGEKTGNERSGSREGKESGYGEKDRERERC